MSEFTVCNFTAFLCWARDGTVCAKGSSGSPSIWDSDVLVLLLPAVCEKLENMSVMYVLHDSGFDMSLSYMAYSRSQDVDWPWCMSSWFPYDLKMGGIYDILSRSAYSTCHRNADGKPIGDRIYQLPLCFLYQGISILYRLFGRRCVRGSLNTIHVRSRGRRSCHRFLRLLSLTRTRLILEVRATETFPT